MSLAPTPLDRPGIEPESVPEKATRRTPSTSKRTRLVVLNVLSIVGGIAIWWFLALNGFNFPTPGEVALKAVALWDAGILQKDIAQSLTRVLSGF